MKKQAYSCAIIYNKEGKLLMQHRTDDAPRLPGFWSLFGGCIEEGETPLQALVRELVEEIEYRAQDPVLIFNDKYERANEEFEQFAYLEAYDDTQPIVLHEGQGFGWFSFAEALQLKLSDQRRAMLLELEPLLTKLASHTN